MQVRVFAYKYGCEFQQKICSRQLQIAHSNQPIKIAILWDTIAVLVAISGLTVINLAAFKSIFKSH